MLPPVSVTGPMTPPRRRRRHGRASSVSLLAASFTPHHRRPQNLRGCFFTLRYKMSDSNNDSSKVQNKYFGFSSYSKALRCTFFGERKNSGSSKLVQLLLLYRQDDEKLCCSRFLRYKFVQLEFFWTQFKNLHLQGPCSLRPCISRPYCITKIAQNR